MFVLFICLDTLNVFELCTHCSFSCCDPVTSYSSFPSLVFHLAGRRSLFDLSSQQRFVVWVPPHTPHVSVFLSVSAGEVRSLLWCRPFSMSSLPSTAMRSAFCLMRATFFLMISSVCACPFLIMASIFPWESYIYCKCSLPSVAATATACRLFPSVSNTSIVRSPHFRIHTHALLFHCSVGSWSIGVRSRPDSEPTFSGSHDCLTIPSCCLECFF